MKKFFLSFAIATIFSLSINTPANAADTYQLDPNHTNITWSANHFGFSSPSGKFSTSSGTIILDEENPQNSSLTVTIRTNSLQTGNGQFDNSLKGENFLNSLKFPDATFVSKDILVQGKRARITGDFTFLGATKSLTLDAKLNKIGINPLTQKKTAGFSATANIKRSDFGMNFGIPGISDTVRLAIEAEAILDKPSAGKAPSADQATNINADKPWVISAPSSKIEFVATQGAANITGSFAKFDGQIVFDPAKLDTSKVLINIDMSSVAISISDALITMQGPEWFALAQFPKATFAANKFKKLDGNDYIASGKLTVKGKAVPTELYFSLDTYSNTNAVVTGYAILKRSDFNIGSKDIKKANGINDGVKVQFTITTYKR